MVSCVGFCPRCCSRSWPDLPFPFFARFRSLSHTQLIVWLLRHGFRSTSDLSRRWRSVRERTRCASSSGVFGSTTRARFRDSSPSPNPLPTPSAKQPDKSSDPQRKRTDERGMGEKTTMVPPDTVRDVDLDVHGRWRREANTTVGRTNGNHTWLNLHAFAKRDEKLMIGKKREN